MDNSIAQWCDAQEMMAELTWKNGHLICLSAQPHCHPEDCPLMRMLGRNSGGELPQRSPCGNPFALERPRSERILMEKRLAAREHLH